MNVNYMRGKPVPDPSMDNVWPDIEPRQVQRGVHLAMAGAREPLDTGDHYLFKSNNLCPKLPEGPLSQPRPDRATL